MNLIYWFLAGVAVVLLAKGIVALLTRGRIFG